MDSSLSISKCIFILLLLLLAKTQVNAKPQQFKDCHQTSSVIDSLFEYSLFEEYETMELVADAYTYALENNCAILPQILNHIGFKYYSENDLINAKKILLEAEHLLMKGQHRPLYKIYNQRFLGLVYILEKNYSKAEHYLSNSAKIASLNNDSLSIADAYLNMGSVKRKQDSLDKSIEMYQQALDIAKFQEPGVIQAYAVMNTAIAYYQKGQYKLADKYINESHNMWLQLDQPRGLYHNYHIKSKIAKANGQIKQQISYLEKALDVIKGLPMNIHKDVIYKDLATAHNSLGHKEAEAQCYKLMLENGQIFNPQELNTAASKLVDIYNKEGNTTEIKNMFATLTDLYSSTLLDKEVESKKWLNDFLKLEKTLDKNINLNQAKTQIESTNTKLKKTLGLLLFVVLGLLGSLYYIIRQARYIKTQNNELQLLNNEISIANATINKQNENLSVKNQELLDFAYVASHDLKAPLRTIASYSGLIKHKLHQENYSEVEETLSIIEKACNNMTALVTNLLDFSTLNQDKIKLESTSTKDMINDVLNLLAYNINEAKAEITVEELPKEIITDEIKLKLVFQNIISNAIKFRKTNSVPQINISYESSEDFHKFSIKDNGIGIEANQVDDIFKMFSKLHSRDQYAGSGIGLATCLKIVNFLKGTIKVQSELGHGTEFIISIPKAYQQQEV